MLTELTRLNSHLVWLGTHAIDIGAMTVFLYCFREREDILRIFEMFSGQRMMTSYFRIGGLALEPPRGWQQRVKKFIDVFPEPAWTNTKTCSPTTASGSAARKGVGYISLEDMLDLGVTGPMLRAAGLEDRTRARTSPIPATRSSISKCPRAPKTTSTRATRCASRKCGRARASSGRRMEGMPSGPWKADAPARGAARPREDEDPDGGPHLPFQDRDRGFPRARRRGLPGDRIAARRAGLLRGERRHRASRTACTCGRPASATCRPRRTWWKAR